MREAEGYPCTRPYLPIKNQMGNNVTNDEEYNPESIQNHARSTVSPSRQQTPMISSKEATIPWYSDVVKLDIKISEWTFNFEGPYSALQKTFESLGFISDQISHARRR